MSRSILLLLSVVLVAASCVAGQTIVSKYGASPFIGIDVDVATGYTFAISGSSIVCSDLNGTFLSAFSLPSSLSAAPAAIAISRKTSILYLTDSVSPQRIFTLSTNGTLLNTFPLRSTARPSLTTPAPSPWTAATTCTSSPTTTSRSTPTTPRWSRSACPASTVSRLSCSCSLRLLVAPSQSHSRSASVFLSASLCCARSSMARV